MPKTWLFKHLMGPMADLCPVSDGTKLFVRMIAKAFPRPATARFTEDFRGIVGLKTSRLGTVKR